MEGNKSHTSVATFVPLGLSDWRELQLTLFPVFLGVYLVTLAWNLGLIILIRTEDHLRTPVYFFLSFLSSIDICYSSSVSPRMLSDFFRGEKAVSLLVCATQYFVLAWMGMSECCLLAAMAYDRYVAIGRPLQYSAIMVPCLCQKMVAGVFGTGFLSSLAQIVSCFHLYYCQLNIIQHFFCDIPRIITLSCSHPYISLLIVFLSAIFIGFGSFLGILLSYCFIAAGVLKISSVKRSSKAFSTGATHLATVALFYGTVLLVYLHCSSGRSVEQNKALSMVYIIFIPILNPLIHSLRNREIKEALKRVVKTATHSCQAGIITPRMKVDLRILKRPFVGCKNSQVESRPLCSLQSLFSCLCVMHLWQRHWL